MEGNPTVLAVEVEFSVVQTPSLAIRSFSKGSSCVVQTFCN